jgi:beta-lactamase regulating signal transducer with metallopeptidase domain
MQIVASPAFACIVGWLGKAFLASSALLLWLKLDAWRRGPGFAAARTRTWLSGAGLGSAAFRSALIAAGFAFIILSLPLSILVDSVSDRRREGGASEQAQTLASDGDLGARAPEAQLARLEEGAGADLRARDAVANAEGGTRPTEIWRVPRSAEAALLALWALGALARFSRNIARRKRLLKKVNGLSSCVDGAWLAAFAEASSKFRAGMGVRLLSAPITSPFSVRMSRSRGTRGGYAIVVPADGSSWTHARRLAAMTHEYAHLDRGDLLWMELAEAATCLAWCIAQTYALLGNLAFERELACDELALSAGCGTHEYAHMLLDLSYSGASEPFPGTQGIRGQDDINRRIRMILRHEGTGKNRAVRWTISILALVFIGIVAIPPIIGEEPASGAARVAAAAVEDGKTITIAICRISGNGSAEAAVRVESVPMDGLPLASPVAASDAFRVTNPFGIVEDPWNGSTMLHLGVDIANFKKGASVSATIGGKVAATGEDAQYGTYVLIQSGQVVSCFYHLDRAVARKGASVAIGDPVGTVGNSGRSTGPHLEYAVFRSYSLDPAIASPADLVGGYYVDPLALIPNGAIARE